MQTVPELTAVLLCTKTAFKNELSVCWMCILVLFLDKSTNSVYAIVLLSLNTNKVSIVGCASPSDHQNSHVLFFVRDCKHDTTSNRLSSSIAPNNMLMTYALALLPWEIAARATMDASFKHLLMTPCDILFVTSKERHPCQKIMPNIDLIFYLEIKVHMHL